MQNNSKTREEDSYYHDVINSFNEKFRNKELSLDEEKLFIAAKYFQVKDLTKQLS